MKSQFGRKAGEDGKRGLLPPPNRMGWAFFPGNAVYLHALSHSQSLALSRNGRDLQFKYPLNSRHLPRGRVGNAAAAE